MADRDVIVWRGVIQRPLRKMIRHPKTQAATWVDDGVQIADVEVTINAAEIAAELGRRAMSSKARKARGLHGAVKVKADNLRRQP